MITIPNSDQLYQAVARKKPLHTNLSQIDHNKLFIPEHLTQLYHTSAYSMLNDKQRLRYNQLFSMRAIEQLMTLEQEFIASVLKRTEKSSRLKLNRKLITCMHEMALEEEQHYQMFYSVNRLADPDIYLNKEMFFARFTRLERFALNTLLLTPGINLFLLWILLILEEFSTFISTQMIRAHKQFPDKLDSNFVNVHREHLKDETRHVAICANLITTITEDSHPLIIKLNTFLLKKFMRDYMTPKRGGIRVIERLALEFPELADKKPELIEHVKNQKQDKVILEAIQDPKSMPYSHELFKQHPEFYFLNPSTPTT